MTVLDSGDRRRGALISPWIDEFRDQLASVLRPTRGLVLDLAAFEQLDGRLARNSLTREDVEKELRDGILSARMVGEDSPQRRRYRLSTRQLDVTLHTEPSDMGRSRLTVLDNAFRRRDQPSEWQAPVTPAAVALHYPRNAPPCDLDLLVEQVHQRRWLLEAEHTLTRIRLTPRLHTELRNEVRRRFGSLRTLLELAKQRADKGDKAVAHGIVIDGPTWFGRDHPSADDLVIRLDQPAPFPVEDDAVRLAVWPFADPGASTKLDAADITDEIVVLTYPDKRRDADDLRRRLPPGTRVTVSEAGDFRFQRHLYAVYNFLDEKTTGNWTALATLLCEPEKLAHPADAPDTEPSTRALNPLQRQAVAGALAAPHAYLIQGPPGTGKTQVITEIASRLAARGERVLLTAPTHVALDEVLRRLADEPGVLPLRLSWNDKYVASDVRRFTPSGYDATVADTLRTPANSKLVQWRERLKQVTAQHDAITVWLQARSTGRSAEQALSTARQAAVNRAAARADQMRQHDTELERLRLWAQHHDSELARIEQEERAVHDRRTARQQSRRWIGQLLDSLGIGVVSRLLRQERRLRQARAAALDAYREAYDRHARQQDARNRLATAFTDEERTDQAAVLSASQAHEDVVRQVDEAATALEHLGLNHLLTDEAAASDLRQSLDASRRGLQALTEVQQRWFDLVGTTGIDEAEDRRRAQNVVRRALSSAANLICTTATGFGGAKTFRDLDYDTLIVDEASKVTVAEFLIPARRAQRWILVGDEKQLTPYVDPDVEHHIHAMAAIHLSERDARYGLKAAVQHLGTLWKTLEDAERHPFRTTSVERVANRLLDNGTWASAHQRLYADQTRHLAAGAADPEQRLLEVMHEHLVTSLFERCVATVHPQTGPRCQLKEQRRMTPEIAELVRAPVYGGDYTSPPRTDPELPHPLLSPSFQAPIVFLDTSTQSSPWDDLPAGTTSFVNKLEAEWVVEVCRRWNDELQHLGVPGPTSISVLAFYGAQARLIRHKLGHPRYTRFPNLAFKVVDSIDRIQGQQSDIVVISFCRTLGKPKDQTRSRTTHVVPPPRGWAPWLQNINRLNVACTRARRSLVLVGHRPTLSGLNGTPAAEAFYANLFRQQQRGTLEINVDWISTRRRRQP
jgi:KaiC/GvpD/RAD55 family RecA-like ATPase